MGVSASITAAGNFTDWISPREHRQGELRALNLSIYGSGWTGTVTLQRTFDDGTNALDVETYTENAEKLVLDTEAGMQYRVGVANSDSISGTVNVRLG